MPPATIDQLRDSITWASKRIEHLENQLAELSTRADLPRESIGLYRESIGQELSTHREWSARWQRWIDVY